MLSAGRDFLRFDADGSHVVVPFADLITVDVSGSAETTNAGLIGGGLGLEGAVVGILAATAINAVTSSTSVSTTLRISTRDAEVILHTSSAEPADLRTWIAPAIVHVEAARVAGRATPTAAEELRGLHALLRDGLIDESEFAAAKLGILARFTDSELG